MYSLLEVLYETFEFGVLAILVFIIIALVAKAEYNK